MRPSETASAHEQEFPYGWRYVKKTRPDGGEELQEVPLTLEDVLHPQEGDVIPINTTHDEDCDYLASVFRRRRLGPPFALVTHDLLIDWGVAGLGNHSPDIAVFVGLSHDPRPTGLLELRELNGRCELAVEIVSPSTRDNDVIRKVEHYHQAGIPLYLIIDQRREDGPRSLIAYKWEEQSYTRIPLDEHGTVEVPILGLKLGVRDDRAVCYDSRTGEELCGIEGLARRLEQADQRDELREQELDEQAKARQEAERKASDAERLAEQHRKERVEAERQADAARKEREEAERKAADAQKLADQQRLALEERERRILELETRLRDLQTGSASDPTAPPS